jgi:hypothetical protein
MIVGGPQSQATRAVKGLPEPINSLNSLARGPRVDMNRIRVTQLGTMRGSRTGWLYRAGEPDKIVDARGPGYASRVRGGENAGPGSNAAWKEHTWSGQP